MLHLETKAHDHDVSKLIYFSGSPAGHEDARGVCSGSSLAVVRESGCMLEKVT